MSIRLRKWVVLFFAFMAVVYWGCTQPSDVLVPISVSVVTLSPQLLPSNFPGMHYELWVANSTDSVSMGKFGYDGYLKRFLDTSGAIRLNENRFELNDNIYNFAKIFVSVEVAADPDPASPGPIMLIDDITNPVNSAVDLVFPMSELIWEATCRYNMETTSDSDRAFKDGYGLWFASYQRLIDSVRDTFSLDSFWVDTSYEQFSRDTTITNLINITNIIDFDVIRTFGVDKYTSHVVRYDNVTQTDTFMAAGNDSVLVTVANFRYTVGPVSIFNYDQFTQDSFALPNYSGYGWKYKGWVVSPYVDTADVGKITLPAWIPNSDRDSLISGINGGLLTTGTFSQITQPDDANPYAQSNRLPQFPGEDFLLFPDNSTWSGLVPNFAGNSGTVFITLEPLNFVSDSTNFPLIAFAADIPDSQTQINGDQVIINMLNWTQTIDPRLGFPRIRVGITTF